MKKIIAAFILVLILATVTVSAQNRSITFMEKPFAELKEMARKENKLIFMDAYATWCGPCKWMAANIFTNDTVADFYNQSFICTKFDMEKGEGLSLRQQYQVAAYPTLLFIDGNGNLVHKKVGASRVVGDYISLARNAMNPDEQFATYVKKYQEGKIPPERMYSYFERMTDAYQPVTEQVALYFSKVPDSEMTSRENWKIIFSYVDDIQSKPGRYLVANEKKYARLYTDDSVNQKVSSLFIGQVMKAMKNPAFTISDYEKMKTGFQGMGYSRTTEVMAYSDLNVSYMLYNRGSREEAVKYAKAALQSAKAANIPVEKYEEAVRRMEQP